MTQQQSAGVAEELVWRGELALQRIIKLREEIVAALAGSMDVRLRLVDVSEVDVSFLQLLCAAHRTAVRDRKQLLLTGQLPAPFVEVLHLAGLNRHVGCSLDCDGSCLWKQVNTQK